MGWSTLHKPKYQTTKEWFLSNWSGNNYEILDVACVGYTELYAAAKNKVTNEVVAITYMINHYPKSYYNFGYKDMDETVMPYMFNCPERIMKLLTPTDNVHSNDWRKNVYRILNNAKILRKDCIVETFEPINFTNGYSGNLFKKVGKRVMGLNPDMSFNCHVNLSLKKHNFTVVEYC